jgi:hypothetical protein
MRGADATEMCAADGPAAEMRSAHSADMGSTHSAEGRARPDPNRD